VRYRVKCWAAQLDKAMKPLGWHVWVSSGGTINATTARSMPGFAGSGETLDAPTVYDMRRLLQTRVTA
jgi:hypothetical protein